MKRLSDKNKKGLVEGYRSGKSTINLAEEFQCSQNTVIRVVKTLLSSDEYLALKVSRSKGLLPEKKKGNLLESYEITPLAEASEITIESPKVTKIDLFNDKTSLDSKQENSQLELANNDLFCLALNDADDFSEHSDIEISDNETNEQINSNQESNGLFHEITPLNIDFESKPNQALKCYPLSSGGLPETVYLLVDRSVELQPKLLKEFPELGVIPKEDEERKVLYLFSNQRSAKRQCGRNQRVLKIPDTSIFELSSPYLIGKGITRLILDRLLIALDEVNEEVV